jgi:hypothetical protein
MDTILLVPNSCHRLDLLSRLRNDLIFDFAPFRFARLSAAEILNELPKLDRAQRRAIAYRVFELEGDREEIEWAAQATDLAFQELDRIEEESGPPAKG